MGWFWPVKGADAQTNKQNPLQILRADKRRLRGPQVDDWVFYLASPAANPQENLGASPQPHMGASLFYNLQGSIPATQQRQQAKRGVRTRCR